MADLTSHRGTASALLAAGVAALAVIGGATAIVHARGTAPSVSAPAIATHQAATVRPLRPSKRLAVKGLHRWRPAKLPKRLALKPVVQHPHKIVTVVKTVSVAAPPARTRRTAASAAKQPAAPARDSIRGGEATPVASTHTAQPPSAAPVATTAPPVTTAPSVPQVPVPPPAAPVTTAPPAPPAPPVAPPVAPTARVAITGGTNQGQTLTATWAGADPAATTYQWQLCDKDGHACQPIAGETGPTYVLKATDVGLTLRVVAVVAGTSSTSRATDQIETGG